MIKYIPKQNEIGKSLLDIFLYKNDMKIHTPCSGNGRCGKCLIKAEGELSLPSEREKMLLGDKIDSGFRLACMCCAQGEFFYEFTGEKISKIQGDFSGENAGTSFSEGYGMAVDVGTTTVAVYLVELASGRVISSDLFQNPQTVHASDIISRILFTETEKNGLEILYDEINGAIVESKNKLCKSPLSRVVICGNTVMEHILCKTDVSSLAKLPFTPLSLFGDKHSLPVFDNAYIAPCIGGYVGGDISMGAVAAGIDKEKKTTLYIDIGTNGEIVLISDEKIYTCATAAGPAFEGADIECGCSAVPGAISRVYYDGGKLRFETIDNKKPCGICGSGLIDCIAVMLDCGILDSSGRLNCEKYFFCEDVYISQKDIRNIQSAKAAIAAGIDVLLDRANEKAENISKTVVAGGFGTHINTQSAEKIGLIPGNVDDVISVGNSAGHGAVNCVLNDNEIKRTEEFAKKAEYTELSLCKKFNEFYIDEMCFEEKE